MTAKKNGPAGSNRRAAQKNSNLTLIVGDATDSTPPVALGRLFRFVPADQSDPANVAVCDELNRTFWPATMGGEDR